MQEIQAIPNVQKKAGGIAAGCLLPRRTTVN